MQLMVLGSVDDGEHVACQAHIHGLHQVQHRGGCDGSIHRVAALAQNLKAGLRRQRLAGGDHAVARHHFRAALRQPAFGAVARHGLAEGRRIVLVVAAFGGKRRSASLRRDQNRGRAERQHNQRARNVTPNDISHGCLPRPTWVRRKICRPRPAISRMLSAAGCSVQPVRAATSTGGHSLASVKL